MQAFVKHIWLAEAKAIFLLQMAVKIQIPNFEQGPGIIKTYTGPGEDCRLRIQEKYFEFLVGTQTINLYEAVMKHPTGATPIEFHPGNEGYVWPWKEKPQVKLGQRQRTNHTYYLVPKQSLVEPQPNQTYIFTIVSRLSDFKYAKMIIPTDPNPYISWGNWTEL